MWAWNLWFTRRRMLWVKEWGGLGKVRIFVILRIIWKESLEGIIVVFHLLYDLNVILLGIRWLWFGVHCTLLSLHLHSSAKIFKKFGEWSGEEAPFPKKIFVFDWIWKQVIKIWCSCDYLTIGEGNK